MGLNVLIVDDSATMRAMVKRTLQMSGVPIAAIYEAGHGLEGLETLDKEWIDLVLLDINMPVMGGMEMLEEVKGKPEFENIPVIVVSTESSETRISEIRDKGVEFIHKPFTPEIVRSVVFGMIGDLQNADNGIGGDDSF